MEEGGAEAEHLKLESEAEIQDNKLDFKRRQGDVVLYGQTIQLLHVASQRFVRAIPTSTAALETR